MTKKKNLSKKGIQEKVQPITAINPDTQYDVVPKDEIPQETPEETPVQQVIHTDEAETRVESQDKIEVQPEASKEVVSESKSESEVPANLPQEPKPLTMITLKQELDDLKAIILTQSQQIADLLNGPVLKRKPVASNNKCEILDKETGRKFKSKNNTFQTLFREGTLKELVEKGTFGPDPAHNNFSWYALARAYPQRFEEIKPEPQESFNETK